MKRLQMFLFPILGLATAFGQTVPDMLERTLPGVVTVAINETNPVKKPLGVASASENFERAYNRVLDLSDAKGSGSGFVIRRGNRTLVITNAHVVEMAQPDAIYAYSINQTRYRMNVVGGDSFYDIAILEFAEPNQPGPELTPLAFRTTEVRVGEPVYALGNPLGEYPYSVSEGIIGGRNRLLGGLTGRLGYLQHTASIIWGNSGGPLVDTMGRIVGLNTRIEIADRGQAFLISQLNFALEGSIAQRVIERLLANRGRLNRPYLGLELTQRIPAGRFNKAVVTEARIESVVAGSPGAALRKYVGYRVDRIGKQAVRNLDEAMAAIEALKPGQAVEFELSKDTQTEVVTIQAGELNDQSYVQLANHILQQRSSFEAAEQEGLVLLRRRRQQAPAAAGNMRLSQLGGQRRKAGAAPSAQPDVLGVFAVGFVPEARGDQERPPEPMLYRVQSVRDFGVALRLMFMAGGADLVVASPQNPDEPIVLRWSLSNAQDTIVRMLVC